MVVHQAGTVALRHSRADDRGLRRPSGEVLVVVSQVIYTLLFCFLFVKKENKSSFELGFSPDSVGDQVVVVVERSQGREETKI